MEENDDVDSDVSETEPLIKTDVTRNSSITAPKEPGLISTRYTLAIMSFFGFLNIYAMRVNLSVALVAMVNTTLTNHSSVCPAANVTHIPKNGEFNWDESTQGQILGSFYYGYVFTQIPGGLLAGRYGAKKIFGLGALCTAVLTLVTPLAARAGYQYLIAVRILEGVGEGVTYPAMHCLWGHWAPPLERSRLVTISYSGCHIGTVLALPISGLLSDLDFLGGWPLAFYGFGTSSLIWFILWMLLVHDKPSTHPRISDVERVYIESSIGDKDNVHSYSVPWWSLLTSAPVWGLVISYFCSAWGFYTLLTELPTYLKVVLGFDLSQSGFLAAVPFLALWCAMVTSGYIADFLISHQIFSTTVTRKIFTALGLTLPGIFLVFTGYVGCDHTIAMALLSLSVMFWGLTGSGLSSNHLDIAPRYAGLLMGITNMVASIPGFLSPVIVGLLTEDHETFQRWSEIFWISCGIYLFGTIAYIVLGSGKKQPWAMNSKETSGIRSQDVNHSIQNDAGPINASIDLYCQANPEQC